MSFGVTQGCVLTADDDEPPRGTVVIGVQRDAWQRGFSDGKWRSTGIGGWAGSWGELLEKNLGRVRVIWCFGGLT